MKKLLIILLSVFIASCVDPKDLVFSSGVFCQESPEVELRDELYYFKNEKQPYSGDNICIYKGNGGYAIQGEIKNGVKYGVETSWHKNGQIMKKGNFIDGKEEGNWAVWYENGQITAKGNFIDGKEDGKFTSWYENGQKWGEGNFIDGKEDGKFTSWYENGQIEAEAIYKDGECVSGDCDDN